MADGIVRLRSAMRADGFLVYRRSRSAPTTTALRPGVHALTLEELLPRLSAADT
jgi:hypothetical protein